MGRKTNLSSLFFVFAVFLFLFLIPVLSILVSVLIDGLFQWTSVNLKPFVLRVLISVPLLFIGGYPWDDARVTDETKTLVIEAP